MGRNILAVVLGFIAMALIIVIAQFGGYFMMGADRAYKPESFDLSMMYLVLWAVSGLVAAIVGGIICAKVSKHSKGAVISMIVVMFVFSGFQLVGALSQPELTPAESVRTPDMDFEVIMERSRRAMPIWIVFANPIIGTIGIIAGATLVCPKHGPKSSNESSDTDAE